MGLIPISGRKKLPPATTTSKDGVLMVDKRFMSSGISACSPRSCPRNPIHEPVVDSDMYRGTSSTFIPYLPRTESSLTTYLSQKSLLKVSVAGPETNGHGSQHISNFEPSWSAKIHELARVWNRLMNPLLGKTSRFAMEPT